MVCPRLRGCESVVSHGVKSVEETADDIPCKRRLKFIPDRVPSFRGDQPQRCHLTRIMAAADDRPPIACGSTLRRGSIRKVTSAPHQERQARPPVNSTVTSLINNIQRHRRRPTRFGARCRLRHETRLVILPPRNYKQDSIGTEIGYVVP